MAQYSPRARQLAQELRAKATRNIARQQAASPSSSRNAQTSERAAPLRSRAQISERTR
jgi:hypothetical protein